MKKTILSLSLALTASGAFAYKVIGIADGDTMTLLVDQNPLRIRLAYIDAPEKKQAFGQRAKQSLSELCWGKDATYVAHEVEKWGRTVANVSCGGIDVSRAQVERGMAWVYRQYNHDASLPALEEQAKRERRGLWSDKGPVPPWVFRHDPSIRQAGYDSTCFTGPRGGHFQIVEGRKRYGC